MKRVVLFMDFNFRSIKIIRSKGFDVSYWKHDSVQLLPFQKRKRWNVSLSKLVLWTSKKGWLIDVIRMLFVRRETAIMLHE